MKDLFAIEIEPEVRSWLETLPAKHFLKVDEYAGLLAEHAASLGEPYARYLSDGIRELRPTLGGAGPAHDEFVRVIEEGEVAK
ncbi:hypothetical protein DY218_09875 [Streptomyces triticagri]|uniref:Uncharacterized protein n=1 Tax=Streptomyces triticagri TaxID=2293568 RepID=A0A372M8K6_9ACTN|nr:type II toxin-antitoxin system RelE/ParE family toxin [Streptomyces triticagri]RFU86940.1 hypothetical protein DY218_09875 [Streptomyces triticagri]